MAASVGSTVLDFGATPTDNWATVAVTGQAGIVAGSAVDAWLRLEATADHGADEHRVEDLEIQAGAIVAGTGFTLYARSRCGKTWGRFTISWVWI